MFTGIVEELGAVTRIDDLGSAVRLAVRGETVTSDAAHGDSISVNGVCLTVVAAAADEFTADVMKETLDRSALGALQPGDPVNLERAATPATRLGGHIVQGHVDGMGTVLTRRADGEGAEVRWEVVRISVPQPLRRYLVEKGSVTVDGVSLTVSAMGPDWFEVSLIPTTLRMTTLGQREPGATVNLEVDVIAKYVESLLEGR